MVSADSSAGSPEPAAPLSTAKKAAFSVIAFVLLPLLLLCLVEGALRLAGYGYPTSFLKRVEIGGKGFLVENDKFGLRFFAPELARSPPPIVLPAVKEKGTYRVFVVGESAALGDPRPAFGPGRYLQAILEQRYPGAKFEIVPAAMTAVNSHALLPIVRECARYEPDAWIIYMGNNEMVGPFGAASVFGARAPSAGYVRLILALQRLRMGQWVMEAGRKWGGHSSGRVSWGGMKMFLENRIAPGDPRKETVYLNFRKNLRAILKTTTRSGKPVLLNTVAVNLKDCAPFANAGDPQTNSPQSVFMEARALLGSSSPEDVLRARALFERARDADALPFRADSRINLILAEAARDKGIGFVDSAALFSSNAPARIPGREHFLEHVHFDFSGSYLLARSWAEALEPRLSGLNALTPSRAPWPDQASCDEWLALTDWNRLTVYEEIVRRLGQPPFVNQFDHSEQMEQARSRVRAIRARLTPEAAALASGVYQKALQRSPSDHRLHEAYAEFLEGTGRQAEAAIEWLRIRDLIPHHHIGWFNAGRLTLRQGKLDEAQALLDKAVTLRPDLAEGWLELGQLNSLAGRPEAALSNFERQRQLVPGDHRAYYHIGRTLSKLNRREEAIGSLSAALKLKPDFWEARYSLGEELAFAGRIGEARRELEEVIRLRPEYPMAHLNLGVALFQSGDRDGALREFEETLRLDPTNALAAQYIQRLRR